MLFRSSFVWGLKKDFSKIPLGLIKNVAGTAGGVSIPHISLGWDIRDGISKLNFLATGSRSVSSNSSKLNANTRTSGFSLENSINSGISFIQGAHQSAQ